VSTNSPVFPLGFTADGTYVMFSSHLVSNGIMSGLNQGSVGDLRSAQLKAGTTPVVVDSQLTVWNATGTHGTKIVYNTNYNGMVPYAINGTASADLYNADASQASTGTLIITGADANYYLTADKTHLIYSLSAGAMSDGVYSYAVP
jgi:hypothetical protein